MQVKKSQCERVSMRHSQCESESGTVREGQCESERVGVGAAGSEW